MEIGLVGGVSLADDLHQIPRAFHQGSDLVSALLRSGRCPDLLVQPLLLRLGLVDPGRDLGGVGSGVQGGPVGPRNGRELLAKQAELNTVHKRVRARKLATSVLNIWPPAGRNSWPLTTRGIALKRLALSISDAHRPNCCRRLYQQ
ncbi:hypothetical protein QP090_17495 [Actinomadura xylanilytica]|nr:hypothetical protein [Actinomadura xylanilytica]